MEAAAQTVLVRWTAALLLLSRTGLRGDDTIKWLRDAGADQAALDMFAAALAAAPALHAAADAVLEAKLAPYAYVAALIALDPRDAADAAILDWIALRLALPATVIRSANRRYRR